MSLAWLMDGHEIHAVQAVAGAFFEDGGSMMFWCCGWGVGVVWWLRLLCAGCVGLEFERWLCWGRGCGVRGFALFFALFWMYKGLEFGLRRWAICGRIERFVGGVVEVGKCGDDGFVEQWVVWDEGIYIVSLLVMQLWRGNRRAAKSGWWELTSCGIVNAEGGDSDAVTRGIGEVYANSDGY